MQRVGASPFHEGSTGILVLGSCRTVYWVLRWGLLVFIREKLCTG